MPDCIARLNWNVIAQIIVIDVALSGDNTFAIALACCGLPASQRKRAILWGTTGAIGLRMLLMFFALALLEWPGLKIVSGLLLFYIGVKLTQPCHGVPPIQSSENFVTAIKTILIADFAMSLDNALGIASAVQAADTEHRFVLIAFGLALSVPLMIWSSQYLLELLDRFPRLVTVGAALLGWIAGGLIIKDASLQHISILMTPLTAICAKLFGAIGVIVLGTLHARLHRIRCED